MLLKELKTGIVNLIEGIGVHFKDYRTLVKDQPEDSQLRLLYIRNLAMLEVLIGYHKKDLSYGFEVLFDELNEHDDGKEINALLKDKYDNMSDSIKDKINSQANANEVQLIRIDRAEEFDIIIERMDKAMQFIINKEYEPAKDKDSA